MAHATCDVYSWKHLIPVLNEKSEMIKVAVFIFHKLPECYNENQK